MDPRGRPPTPTLPHKERGRKTLDQPHVHPIPFDVMQQVLRMAADAHAVAVVLLAKMSAWA